MKKVYKKLTTQVGKEVRELEFAIVYQSGKYEIHQVTSTNPDTGESCKTLRLTLRNRPDCWLVEEIETKYGITRHWKNYGYYFDFEAMSWFRE